MIGVKLFVLKLYFRFRFGVIIQKNCKVARNVVFEGRSVVFSGTEIYESSVGYGTYFGSNCKIRKSKIGRYCSIADGVTFSLGLHPTRGFVSTYPAFFRKNHPATFAHNDLAHASIDFDEHKYISIDKKYCCEVGSDVWIGADVKVMDGVCIGDGVVIGAGSIVTKNCEPFGVYAGIPAKLIRFRFTEEERIYLSRLQWWLKEPAWLSTHSKYFGSISLLMANVSA